VDILENLRLYGAKDALYNFINEHRSSDSVPLIV
jgi:hypothetical protein